MKLRALSVVLTLLPLVVGCGKDKSSDAAVTVPSVQAGAVSTRAAGSPLPAQAPSAPAETWMAYAPPAGRYGVLFPGAPKEQEQMMDTALGKTKGYVATFSKGKMMLAVQYMDVPGNGPVNVKAGLDGARDGVLKMGGMKLLEEKDISLGKVPGRTLLIDAQELPGTARLRVFVAGRRTYQLMALTGADADPAAVAKFLDSFRIL